MLTDIQEIVASKYDPYPNLEGTNILLAEKIYEKFCKGYQNVVCTKFNTKKDYKT